MLLLFLFKMLEPSVLEFRMCGASMLNRQWVSDEIHSILLLICLIDII